MANPKLLAVVDGAGEATVTFLDQPALVGQVFTVQWLAPERGGLLFGAFALSNGLELPVGM